MIFFGAVVTLLNSFNSNLLLDLSCDFTKFFNHYNILITCSTFFFNNLIQRLILVIHIYLIL